MPISKLIVIHLFSLWVCSTFLWDVRPAEYWHKNNVWPLLQCHLYYLLIPMSSLFNHNKLIKSNICKVTYKLYHKFLLWITLNFKVKMCWLEQSFWSICTPPRTYFNKFSLIINRDTLILRGKQEHRKYKTPRITSLGWMCMKYWHLLLLFSVLAPTWDRNQ